jgi:ABC-2 type transport system permease protein
VGALMGALIHSYSQRDLILSLVNLPIILTAPIFFSIDSAPIFLQVMAMLNPLTYQANLLRDLTLHIPWQFNGVVALALALMFAALSVTALARSEWLTAER